MSELNISHVDKDKCSACEECVHICPQDCFVMDEIDDHISAKFINEDKCDHCGKCLMVCEDNAIILTDVNSDEYIEVHKPELCEACENCVKITHGKKFEIVEEGGTFHAKKIKEFSYSNGDKACCFSCPNEAIVYVKKEKCHKHDEDS